MMRYARWTFGQPHYGREKVYSIDGPMLIKEGRTSGQEFVGRAA